VDQRLQDHRTAEALVQAERQTLVEAKAQVVQGEEAQVVLQRVAAAVQQQAHKRIASVVTQCLAAVFDHPYEFDIQFDRRRGRTEARLQFRRGGKAFDPLSSAGGGAVDVAAFALRLSCLLLSKPRARRLLLLDEPFRFVSARYRPKVAELLQTLSRELKVQIIQVTHEQEYVQGTVLRLQ
jgi:DNA repair exonuclease SbcCD ATPase subunit